ncbi:MAG: hypothetical protein KDA20_06940 [Phycisphaerales bacterium]|nr:hypothetical protein [Phycisphaerales bacterium]
MKHIASTILTLAPLLTLAACDKPAPTSQQSPAPAVPAAPAPTTAGHTTPAASGAPTTLTIDRVTFTAPGNWVAEPPANMMRAAQFRIGADAAAAVFKGIRGSADFNLARWEAQLVNDDKHVQTTERDLTNAKLYHFVGTGTFDGGMSMGNQGPQPNYMVLGALIELGPEECIYIKATGPRATLEPARADWDAMVNSIAVAPAAQ